MSGVVVSSGSSSAPRLEGPYSRPGGVATGRRVVLSLAVAAMGLVDLLSALLSHPPERLTALRHLVPTELLDTSRTFTLLAGALLLVTAWGLRRGKRRAYVTALLLCAVSVPVNVLKALDIEEAVVATGLMFLLGISADAFRVKSRGLSMASFRSSAMWFAVALVAYVGVGELALKANYGMGASWRLAFQDAGYSLLGIGDPVTIITRQLPLAEQRMLTWYHRSLPLLSLAFVLFVAIGGLRPARHRRRHQAAAAQVDQLLRAHGDSTVSAFALADDADYFFSRNGRAVIAYRFESDTLLAIGDPIGPTEELEPMLHDFETYCQERDWQFAFFQARPERLDLYRALGWRWLHIGEDPVLWSERFTLSGGAVGAVRRAVNKADQSGLVARHFVPGVNPFGRDNGGELLDELHAISQEWLHAHPGGEKSFCMGRFDPHHLPHVWLSVAWNPARSRVEGFTTWEPIWARHGWALDLMRRRVDAAPGTMDLLVVKAVEAAKARGDALLSLSLSALARVGQELTPDTKADSPERPGAAETDRAREFLSQHLARFYDFKGLFQWKRKFDPEFEDRYLVYPSSLALPRVALALARAQSPGGFSSYLRHLLPARRTAGSSAAPDGSGASESAT
jgi:phosphatidylglycerol lysyltransferase